MQHGFGESEISWTTTGKANIILDNLIEMGKIKPFTLVMSDGMVQEKVGSEERLNHVLLERMLVEEIIPMAEKNTFDLRSNPVEPAGKKERFRRNMEAIKVLKECEFENRFATPEEQLILSKYVGWGGLPEAFDENNSAWAD